MHWFVLLVRVLVLVLVLVLMFMLKPMFVLVQVLLVHVVLGCSLVTVKYCSEVVVDS